MLAKTLLDELVLEEYAKPADAELAVAGDETGDENVIRERQAFVALHPTLLKQFPDEYVAIHQGKLIDHDRDGLALSLRVRQRFPNEFVWISPVKEQALEEWVVRSPRFESIPR
ncbi:MAG: hypothetical protein R2911_43795 [Caldilineaceae bacterium]